MVARPKSSSEKRQIADTTISSQMPLLFDCAPTSLPAWAGSGGRGGKVSSQFDVLSSGGPDLRKTVLLVVSGADVRFPCVLTMQAIDTLVPGIK